MKKNEDKCLCRLYTLSDSSLTCQFVCQEYILVNVKKITLQKKYFNKQRNMLTDNTEKSTDTVAPYI